ncbi:sugar phosphate isomerase/epimerase family protein [Ktedonospora formicarum]|uniref:Xylose isomerase-like TIM barrel domain-containing protein n=1 Tax=Ktedonospora formicarum TaxID=2778364 RepID=A0A8J3HS84_9CHLR|nr:sugar phosphate isomerase/epimerase family protein [Ktedonospora formicarum]GHO42321.1 hypothetical protein KSX_04840 [Ktedonospora formicarum]
MTQAMQLLCSTGAFSRFPDQTGYQAVLEYGPLLEVDGFELMFYPNWYGQIEQIAHDLKCSSLAFPAMHADKNIGIVLGKPEEEQRAMGIRWLEENCQLARRIGVRVMVLHLWGWPELDDDLERNLESLSACLDVTTRHDIELAIETIPCRRADPLSNIMAALECDNRSQVALDTEFLSDHSQLGEVFQQERLWREQRVRHVHIKDANGQRFGPDGKRLYLHPGEGQIDFASFFASLKELSFVGNISLEAPAIAQDGDVRVKQLRTSLDFLRRLMA